MSLDVSPPERFVRNAGFLASCKRYFAELLDAALTEVFRRRSSRLRLLFQYGLSVHSLSYLERRRSGSAPAPTKWTIIVCRFLAITHHFAAALTSERTQVEPDRRGVLLPPASSCSASPPLQGGTAAGKSDGAGKGGAGQPYAPPNDRQPPSPPPKAQPPTATQPPQADAAGRLGCRACPAWCCATSPYPPTPPIPYPTPMPTRTRVPLTLSLSKGPHLPPPTALQPNAAGCGCRACPGEGRGIALPCFPLSVCGDPPTMPSPHLRRRGPHIRLVPLFQPFQHPPAGPSAPHPARAWQIRLVSLCRLVHLASNPICAAFPQARAAGKSRTHHSAQFKPSDPRRSPAAARCGCRACPACPCCHAVTPTSPRCGCRACPAAVTPATLRTPFRRE